MQNIDEMVHALQHPQIAPFAVTFEIFASDDRKKIAYFEKHLAASKNRSKQSTIDFYTDY